jgi:hypothetical protein
MRRTLFVLMIAGCGDSGGGAPDGPGADAAIDAPAIDAHGVDTLGPDAFSVCDPVAQDCPGTQRCTLNHNVPTNTLFCESMAGTVADLGACTPNSSSDDCVKGDVCLTVSSTLRVCRHFCYSDTDCSGNVCAIIIGQTAGPLHACAQSCSVLQQNCTITGEACYLGLNATNQATQQCSSAGTHAEGDTCAIANDCVAGQMCLQVTGQSGFHCHRACMATSTTQCQASSMCANNGLCCPLVNQNGLGYCQ